MSNITKIHNREKYLMLKTFIASMVSLVFALYLLAPSFMLLSVINWGLVLGLLFIVVSRMEELSFRGKLIYQCFSCEKSWDIRENNKVLHETYRL
ncbi:MAG: hypothetical protein ACOC1O_04305 [bacterium]